MLRLAMDLSTRRASLALADGDTCRAELEWDQKDIPHQRLFEKLPDFWRDAGVTPAELELFVVGVGPGSFSGIRVALAAANGLALPGGIPVHGLPSAAAMAWVGLQGQPTGVAAVVGDARRQRCWAACYRREGDTFASLQDPALFPMQALADALPANAILLTSDLDRLTPLWAEHAPGVAARTWQTCTPRARALLDVAAAWARSNHPLPPPQPLYLHPAV